MAEASSFLKLLNPDLVGGSTIAMGSASASGQPFSVTRQHTGVAGRHYFSLSYAAGGMDQYQIGFYRWGGPLDVGESAPAPPRVLQLGPNPARDHLALRFDLERDGEVQMRVLDVAGRIRASRPAHALGRGTHRLDLALPGLEEMPPGFYIAEVVSRDQVMRRAFVRVR